MLKKNLYTIRKVALSFAFILVVASCKEVYNPHVHSPVTGYLVVEGFINANGISNIRLTRTTKLVDSAAIIYENGAQLNIESDNNESYALRENGNGTYYSDSQFLNAGEKYRLHIITSNGSEYFSEYSTIHNTPAIDSVSWVQDNTGVHIYINTHNDANNTKYYKWNYTETWEFHSAYANTAKWIFEQGTGTPIGVLMTPFDTLIYKCWNTIRSSSLLLGSTEKLSSDKIFLLLHSIEPASIKISVLYSIIVYQHALSKEAYLFYEKLKKNTEQLGSVFDAQPTELKGNIYNTQNSDEPVIGFVEVSTEEQKRIFISRRQLSSWNYETHCYEVTFPTDPDSIRAHGPGLLPTSASLTKVSASQPQCVDCTITGTNVRPDFWP